MAGGMLSPSLKHNPKGFSDMRTKNDLRLLLKDRAFGQASLSSSSSVIPSAEEIARVGAQYKFSKQHMVQLAELYVLKYLKGSDAQPMRTYRLWLKKRIYRKNEEVLGSIEDQHEVKRKIADAYKNVEEDYRRILSSM